MATASASSGATWLWTLLLWALLVAVVSYLLAATGGSDPIAVASALFLGGFLLLAVQAFTSFYGDADRGLADRFL